MLRLHGKSFLHSTLGGRSLGVERQVGIICTKNGAISRDPEEACLKNRNSVLEMKQLAG
jgi:hypothetical protein